MARGIKLTDTVYEVDNGTTTTNATAVIATMLLRMDSFNLGTKKTKFTKSTTTTPLISAHVKGDLNENEFGVHPRYLDLELELTGASSACYGGTQKRRVSLIVPTLAQFNSLKVYDKQKGGTQADTTIEVNHSFDGTGFSTYKITRKVAQRLV
jgi:hypothetical protein